MRPSRPALIPIAILLVAACSSGGATPVAPSTEATSEPPASTAADTRIEVTLDDTLEIEPATMTVPAGVPVTFVVTNAGSTDHEFFLGDETAQIEHDEEMMGMSGMTHDEPEGIGVKPGETKELTFTFPKAGRVLAGCHVNGHYAAGMKASITVTE
jgi:uncharacterized cupredoxin-like copper-binding protein